jgi:hypothetical protein
LSGEVDNENERKEYAACGGSGIRKKKKIMTKKINFTSFFMKSLNSQ